MGRKIVQHPELKLVNFHGIVTTSPQMLEFFEKLRRVSRVEASVLLRGETGTGKELVARALHKLSPRRDFAFKAINCATLTPELIASELFGHVRGSFTGAVRDRKGIFQLADKGIIFLDEVAELPLEIQARLLRLLQEKTFVPVGGTEAISADVRVLSATHRALREEVAKGRFREDLMYRIRVVPLFLPRLADRTGDVEALTWHFIDEYNMSTPRFIKSVDRVAMEALLNYPWPGNVRELRNNIEYAFALGEGPILTLDELTPELRGTPPPIHSAEQRMTRRERERQSILEALDQAGGKKQDAAQILGISRSTLWRKLRELRID